MSDIKAAQPDGKAWGRRELAALAFGGVLAGFCNGLMGAGGGVILVLTLGRVLGSEDKNIFANTLCIMALLSLFTLGRYAKAGALAGVLEGREDELVHIIAGGIVGGACGGVLLDFIRGRTASAIFALVTLLCGVLMLF